MCSQLLSSLECYSSFPAPSFAFLGVFIPRKDWAVVGGGRDGGCQSLWLALPLPPADFKPVHCVCIKPVKPGVRAPGQETESW